MLGFGVGYAEDSHNHSYFFNGFNQIFRKLLTDPKNKVSDLASFPLICSLKASLRMVQTKSATWKILEKGRGLSRRRVDL